VIRFSFWFFLMISNNINLLYNILLFLTFRINLLIIFDILFRPKLFFLYSLSNWNMLTLYTMERSWIFLWIVILLKLLVIKMFVFMGISIIGSLCWHLVYFILKILFLYDCSFVNVIVLLYIFIFVDIPLIFLREIINLILIQLFLSSYLIWLLVIFFIVININIHIFPFSCLFNMIFILCFINEFLLSWIYVLPAVMLLSLFSSWRLILYTDALKLFL
jgi:hypothetical protein